MSEQKNWWGKTPVAEYTFPEQIAEACGHRTVGMVPPTWEDEERATQVGGDNSMRTRNQLVRYGVATIDGRAVEQDGPEVQALFASDPRVRIMLVQAWLQTSSPSDADMAGFTKSRKVVVGG